MNEDPTVALARFLMVGGLIGAVALVLFSWPAALMFLVIAGIGRYVMIRQRPTSRWARGWSAFKQRNPPGDF